MKTPNDYAAILFDCDGVLVDSERIATRAMQRTLNDLGWEIDEDEVADTFTGHSWPECVKIVEAREGRTLPESFFRNNRVYFGKAMHEELAAMPGVIDVLPKLTPPYAVVTNSRKDELDMKLDVAGLSSFIPDQNRFDAETLAVAKPDPAIYQIAAETLGVQIADCLIVEDSVPGLTAAVHSGADVWAYRPHVTPEQLAGFSLRRVFEEWSDFTSPARRAASQLYS